MPSGENPVITADQCRCNDTGTGKEVFDDKYYKFSGTLYQAEYSVTCGFAFRLSSFTQMIPHVTYGFTNTP